MKYLTILLLLISCNSKETYHLTGDELVIKMNDSVRLILLEYEYFIIDNDSKILPKEPYQETVDEIREKVAGFIESKFEGKGT